MKVYTVILICLSVMFFSCAASNFGWTPEEDGSSREKTGMNESFDPLSLNDDDITIEKTEASQEDREEKEIAPARTLIEEEEDQPEYVPGYRVQIMLGKNESAINEEKKKAMFAFQKPVYVIFESPYYKIRIGDFLTHDAAVPLLELAKRKGFEDAFIAKCLVNRKSAVQ